MKLEDRSGLFSGKMSTPRIQDHVHAVNREQGIILFAGSFYKSG